MERFEPDGISVYVGSFLRLEMIGRGGTLAGLVCPCMRPPRQLPAQGKQVTTIIRKRCRVRHSWAYCNS